jgi:hypothetical protein
MVDLSLVYGPRIVDKSTVAVSISMPKGSYKVVAVRKIQFTNSMRLLVEPFTDVNSVSAVDAIGCLQDTSFDTRFDLVAAHFCHFRANILVSDDWRTGCSILLLEIGR